MADLPPLTFRRFMKLFSAILVLFCIVITLSVWRGRGHTVDELLAARQRAEIATETLARLTALRREAIEVADFSIRKSGRFSLPALIVWPHGDRSQSRWNESFDLVATGPGTMKLLRENLRPNESIRADRNGTEIDYELSCPAFNTEFRVLTDKGTHCYSWHQAHLLSSEDIRSIIVLKHGEPREVAQYGNLGGLVTGYSVPMRAFVMDLPERRVQAVLEVMPGAPGSVSVQPGDRAITFYGYELMAKELSSMCLNGSISDSNLRY